MSPILDRMASVLTCVIAFSKFIIDSGSKASLKHTVEWFIHRSADLQCHDPLQ